MPAGPDIRRRLFVDVAPDPDGDYVLYWMVASRRLGWTFALDRAVELAEELDRPLLIFEPLRAGRGLERRPASARPRRRHPQLPADAVGQEHPGLDGASPRRPRRHARAQQPVCPRRGDPNSYSGIFWVLGRFDRGWPEREVFGKVRSMTSRSTRRKVSLDRYLERWGPQGSLL